MPRYLITIEYDGAGYIGWQRQPSGRSIQQCLEEAAGAISGNSAAIKIYGAGRTDARVHALGQAAHFDLPREFNPYKLPLALNAYLEPSIRVVKAERVADGFHARFDAIGRAYCYRIYNRRIAAPLLNGRVWHIPEVLDIDAMTDAAKFIIGTHDFTSFRAQHCQSLSPVRTVEALWFERGRCDGAGGDEGHISMMVEARSFLHHQIRNFTGTLVQVGKGKWTPQDVKTALEAKKRAAAGPTAPPEGLYLTKVTYPDSGTD